MIVKCSYCEIEFEKTNKIANFRIKNNKPMYCCKECQLKALNNGAYTDRGRVTVICAECGTELTRPLSEVAKSKTGKCFCNKSCAAKHNNKLYPKRSVDLLESTNYRRKALEVYGAKCSVCGYAIVEVLEVHHKDSNRDNNNIENLDVLCPTHHKEYQYGIRKY